MWSSRGWTGIRRAASACRTVAVPEQSAAAATQRRAVVTCAPRWMRWSWQGAHGHVGRRVLALARNALARSVAVPMLLPDITPLSRCAARGGHGGYGRGPRSTTEDDLLVG